MGLGGGGKNSSLHTEERGVHLHPCTPPGYGPDSHGYLKIST